jgi:uncharacterized protein (DUF2147 family)
MRWFLLISAATFSLCGVTFAAEPIGEWRVANGDANIRIDDCSGALWGVISWEKDPGGKDVNNTNPAERNRPILGLPILLAMRPTKPNLWEGEVYNAENGKTYNSRLSLSSPDVLRIEGCVFGGLICGGENWTRVKADAVPPAPAQRGGAAPPRGKPTAPPLTACSGIPKR